MLLGFIIKKYLNLTRELKRIELMAYSPIISNVMEVYDGLSQFRNYNQMDQRELIFARNVDNLNKAFLHQKFANNFMMLYSEMTMIILIVIMFIMILMGVIYEFSFVPQNISIIAVSMSWILNIPNFILFLCFFYTEFIHAMGSYERVIKNVDIELSEGSRQHPAPNSNPFPSKGSIEIHNIKCRYRDNLPLVLNGLSFKIADKQKVAVVGRTGSGKSSLILALTRIINIENNLQFPEIAKLQKLNHRNNEYGAVNNQSIHITHQDLSSVDNNPVEELYTKL